MKDTEFHSYHSSSFYEPHDPLDGEVEKTDEDFIWELHEEDYFDADSEISDTDDSPSNENCFSGKNCISSLFGTSGVLLGTAVGISVGILLKRYNLSSDLIAWLVFPGDLFVRGLTSLVVPLVFTTLSVSISDVVILGRAKGIGKLACALFMATSFIAASEGVLFGMLFHKLFKSSETSGAAEQQRLAKNLPVFALQCPNGKFVSRVVNEITGSEEMRCAADEISKQTNFDGEDISNSFQFLNYTRSSYLALGEGGLTKQAQELFRNLIPDNLVQAFAQGTLLSIFSFAIIFGITMAVTSLKFTQQQNEMEDEDEDIDNQYVRSDSIQQDAACYDVEEKASTANFVLEVVRQGNRMLLLVVQYMMQTTPLAIIFLLLAMIVQNEDDPLNMLNNIVFFIFVLILAHLCHVFVALPMLYWIVHQKSPYLYMRKMVPAIVFAFGSSSSMATLPVSIYCMDSTKQTSKSLARVVLQVGSTCNMDGMALYLPIAIIFMLKTAGHENLISWWMILNIVILSTIASIGAAPVPNAGLLMVLAVWQSIAGQLLPVTFPYLVALEWFEDRFQTSTNVMGDAIVTLLMAPIVHETFNDEALRNENHRPKRQRSRISKRRSSSI